MILDYVPSRRGFKERLWQEKRVKVTLDEMLFYAGEIIDGSYDSRFWGCKGQQNKGKGLSVFPLNIFIK